METRCTTQGAHCENCGSTSEEDIGWDAMAANDGYTGCCNELQVGRNDCRNHHGEG